MAATIRVISREADGSIVSHVTIAGVNHILTTVTRSAATVDRWINTILKAYKPRAGSSQSQVVGLEVTCQPNGNIALLQLCVHDRCLIYQLEHSDARPPEEFLTFLDDPRFCYFGHGVEVITYGLQREYGFSVRNTADLGDTAAATLGREDLRRAGLERLAREMMQLEIEKPEEVRRSAWWQPELSEEQIAYACADAFIASELGRILSRD